MNISKLIEANKKIADLKAQLAQHDDVNQSIADLADTRINKLVGENSELKAQVKIFISALKEIQKLPSSRMDEGSTIAFLAIKANP